MTTHTNEPLAGSVPRPHANSVFLCALFFLSGAAALAFETLWFRQAGLAFGNGVWSSSVVLASSMGGLALGNGLAGHYGPWLRRPIVAYAWLEVAVAISGVGLVLLFPVLTELFASLLAPLLHHADALNTVRLALAFLLMLVPASAMGATLPLLTGALTARAGFGPALGRLYGWNTLGALAGAVASETLVIERLGVRGTGILAGSLNVAAAGFAMLLARHASPSTSAPAPASEAGAHGTRSWRLLVAAFVGGCLLLAMEVVWFRFLLLFVHGTALTFALMLGVVLLGIGIGAIAASAWLRRWPEAHRSLPSVALAAGVAVATSYTMFPGALARVGGVRFYSNEKDITLLALQLMLPVTLVSGILFTFLGAALHAEGGLPVRTTGYLTLSNTLGATLGALAAGFLLLPLAGMEAAFAILAASYGVVALLSRPASPLRRTERLGLTVGAAAFTGALGLFPFGLMTNHYLRLVAAQWTREGSRIAAVREGLTETIVYLRRDLWGEAVYQRLLTNGISMSGSHFSSLRYMKLFVYWPVALNPHAKRALLICYGVGGTAQALTDTRSLTSIDVVDISRDILEMSRVAWPPGVRHPLDDPRVRVHVEDGRFFLLTSNATYDLITAEPPPPKMAGVVNLYSQEYFALVRARLAPGGLATHWLPVMQLEPTEAKAIIKGFCTVFTDCSLWTGFGAEWMLAGGRESRAISESEFTAQWRDPLVGPEMQRLGLESPEQLGTLLLGDAEALGELVRDVAPLDDDHPRRLSHRIPETSGRTIDPFYLAYADLEQTRRRFEESPWVRKIWSSELRSRTLAAFPVNRPVQQYLWSAQGGPPVGLPQLHAVLTDSSLRTPVLWLMWSSAREQEIARRARARGLAHPALDHFLAIEAMADRDYARAESLIVHAQRFDPASEPLAQWRVLALCLLGRTGEAASVAGESARKGLVRDVANWTWLTERFRLLNPASVALDRRTPKL
jgi:spermidine synthase